MSCAFQEIETNQKQTKQIGLEVNDGKSAYV